MSKTAEYLGRFMNGVRRRNPGEREAGANIAAFIKVADAMLAFGHT